MKLKFGVLLGAGFCVLATVAAATGNFAVRLDAATQQAQVARTTQTAASSAAAGLGINRIVLTEGRASGLGRFTVRSNMIAPTAGFNIYVEPTGLTSQFQNGAVRASMSVDALIRDARGVTVIAQDNVWQLPIVHPSARAAALPAVYANLTVNPLRLTAGTYQLVLRIHDDLAGTFVDRSLDITLGSPPPGQRLSQAQVPASATVR